MPLLGDEAIPIEYPVNNNALEASTMRQDVSNHTIKANPSPQEILSEIRHIFGDELAPYMYQLALCESTLRQWTDKGEVVKSTTNDYGLFQINEIWEQKALDMNLDFKSDWKSNIRMAKVVYDLQGLGAWVCKKVL